MFTSCLLHFGAHASAPEDCLRSFIWKGESRVHRPFQLLFHSLPVPALVQVPLKPLGGDTCSCPPPGLAETMHRWGWTFDYRQCAPRRSPGLWAFLSQSLETPPGTTSPPPSKGRAWPLERPLWGGLVDATACSSLPWCQPGLPALCRFGC